MELAAIIISAILGWKDGRFGPREWQVMALVVIGWSAVTTAASIPNLTLAGVAFSLVFHAALVVVPCVVTALIRRVLKK